MKDSYEDYPKVYLYRRIVRAKIFMDEHYYEKINLDAIAGEAYFSAFHFLRLFKAAYNKTPHQYLTSIRIEKARELLKSDNETIAEICFTIGFESISSFTSLFRRSIGCSPSQYRMAMHQRARTIKREPLNAVPGCYARSHGWV